MIDSLVLTKKFGNTLPTNHLSIYNKNTYKQDYIATMLDGTRTLGIKFMRKKIAPYQRLRVGDIIYLKEASGPIRGRVRVSSVDHKEITDPDEIMEFLSAHIEAIGIQNDSQLMDIWRANMASRYMSWWTMEKPEIVTSPVFIHKTDRRAWIAGFAVPDAVLVEFL